MSEIVTRNNARTTQSDLEYRCEKLMKEKTSLNDQLLEFQEAVNELQVQSQCQLEDKRQMSSVLSETQRNLSEAERKNLSLESELQELKKIRAEENEEWEKFQSDLLTSVRVANDFKTEAQQDLQRMILENKSYRERERQLKAEIEKLKGDGVKSRKLSGTNSSGSKLSDKENVPNKEMENFLKLTRKNRDKPKKGKDTTDAVSSGSKGEKNREKTPDVLTKMVKRREKKPTASKKNKTLSVEEELLLKSLNDWYENIDKNTPEDKLTEEEKVVRKLKTLYEDEGIKERPVAHKPKDQLAISKPLLDSVFLNPKLEEIAKDPSVPTIEEIGKSEVLSYGSPELRHLPDKIDREERVKSNDFRLKEKNKRLSIISRSKSLDDLYILEEKQERNVLYRSNETEDLRNQRESSILPSDSVSNPRYSDFAVVVNSQENLSSVQEKPSRIKVARNSSVNYETLGDIISSIPKNTPESRLNSEQRFALRLKKALDEAERKNTLKKQRRNKKLVISSPLAESVRRNPGLRAILQDPRMKSIRKRRNSESQTKDPLPSKTMRESKSYQDISFTFEANEYRVSSSDGVSVDICMSVTEEISVPESFADDDMDEEVNTRFKNIRDSIQLPYKGTVRDDSDLNSVENEEFDSLTYNETLKKSVRNGQETDVKRPTTQNLDLLYKENSRKNKELEEILKNNNEAANLYTQNKTVDQDFDLIYNETVNRKVRLNVNRDKHDTQQPTENTPDCYADLHNLSEYQQVNLGCQQPLDEKIDFQEISENFEDYPEVVGEFGRTLDVGDEDKELTFIETSNEDVKFPNRDKYFEDEDKEHINVIAKETVVVKDHDVEENKPTYLDPQIPDLYDVHNKLNDNFSKFHLDFSTDIADTDVETEDNDEYNYHSILKENRVGVMSPLNIRLVYKDVVKEIKHKFPQDEDIKEDIDAYEDDGSQDNATFFDDFFGVKPKLGENEPPSSLTKNVEEIDREMEEIFDKYLHTPLSKVITQIPENSDNQKPTTVSEDSKQNELTESDDVKTSDSETKASSLNENNIDVESKPITDESDSSHIPNQLHKGSELLNRDEAANYGENSEQSLEEIMLIIDDTEKGVDNESKAQVNDLVEVKDNNSLEVVSIFDESSNNSKNNKDDEALNDDSDNLIGAIDNEVYINEDTREDLLFPVPMVEIDEIDKTQPLLDDLSQGDKEEKLPDIIESVNKNVTDDNVSKEELKSDEAEPSAELTAEELKLLKSVRKERFSRPLSDFGEKDLLLIQEISARYLPELTSELPESKPDDVKKYEHESFSISPQNILSSAENLSNDHEFVDQVDNEVSKDVHDTTKLVKDNMVYNNESGKDPDSIIDETTHENKGKQIMNSEVQEISSIKDSDTKIFGADSYKVKKGKEITKGSQDDDLDTILARMITPIGIKRRLKRKSIKTEDEVVESNIDTKIVPTESKEKSDIRAKPIEIRFESEMPLKKEESIPKVDDTGLGANNRLENNVSDEQNKMEEEIEIDNEDDHELLPAQSVSTSKFSPVPDTLVEADVTFSKVEQIDVSMFLAKPVIVEYEPVSHVSFEQQDFLEFKFDDNIRHLNVSPDQQGIKAKESSVQDLVKDVPTRKAYSIDKIPKQEYERIGVVPVSSNFRSISGQSNTDPRPSANVSVRYLKEDMKYGLKGTLKRDYKGIKDKLEYFSRNEESPPSSTRQSLRAYPGRTNTDTRKVKSWAEHFERRSLDTQAYEPVYANFSSLLATKNSPAAQPKIDKKPLPIPRSRNHNSLLDVTSSDIHQADVKNDTNVDDTKMSDPKNFSESIAKDIVREVTENVFQEGVSVENVDQLPDLPGSLPPSLFLGATNMFEEERTFRGGHKIGIKKSEKFLDVPSEDDIKTPEEYGRTNYAYGAESSFSTIEVAGKVEQLDITRHSELDIGGIETNNQSKLNLFQIETPSYDESYLNLFKQPEDKVYDDITSQRKPQRGFLNIAYLGELSDNDSFDDMLRNAPNLDSPKTKPRIIDFVPLDDATKPVYKKNNISIPDYDTLEREKTFQVLNSAPSDVKVRSFSKLDGSKSSLSSGSSFSQAKKVFEALLEANSEKNAVKHKPLKKRDSLDRERYELKGKLEMGQSSSTVGLGGNGKVEENVEK